MNQWVSDEPARSYHGIVRWAALLLLLPAAAAQDLTRLEGRSLNPPDADLLRSLSLAIPSLPIPRALSNAYQSAWARNDFPAIWRYSTRIALIAKGKPWNDRMEVISSYNLLLDRRIIEPGDPLEVTLQPLFTLGRAARCSCRARLSFHGRELASASLDNFPTITHQVPTASLPDGDYAVEYSLGYFTAHRVFTVRRGLRARLAALGGAGFSLPNSTAQWAKSWVERAMREYYASNLERAHPALSLVPELLPGLAYLHDPDGALDALATAEKLLDGQQVTGSLHLAYRSTLDHTLQPFRVYVPRHAAAEKWPVVVVLHGTPGDEGTYFVDDALTTLAERRGYLVVSPAARGPMGNYTDDSERDVLDVLALALQTWPADPHRVFLTGHSAGGLGGWLIAFKYPNRFAGLAAVATAGMPPPALLQAAPGLPVLVIQGGRDILIPNAYTQKALAAPRSILKNFQYLEFPTDDHFSLVSASLEAVFDFFDRLPP